MFKNLIFCGTGILLGFLLGFLIANAVSRQAAAPQQSARASQTPRASEAPAAQPGTAGPLPPNTGGQLPPNHPDIGTPAGEASAASTSAEAQAAMDEADRKPKSYAAQMRAAETFYDLKDYEKAELYLARALAIHPKDPQALVLMGNSKYDRKDFAGAADFYERALAVRPNDPDVRTDYGNTFFLREPPDFDRAIAEYRKSIAVDPRHEKSWLNLASASIRKRDKATALEAVARLEAVSPQNASIPSLRQGAEALP